MTLEQALELVGKVSTPCDECPFNSSDPQERNCDSYYCRVYSAAKGILLGYNKALEDLKAPKTLAENRD